MNKFAATLVCIYLAAHLSACTSKESREDEATAPTEETAAVDSELEKVDGAEAGNPPPPPPPAADEANAGFKDEQLPEQALGEQPAANKDAVAAADPGAPSASELDAPAAPPAADAPADSSIAQQAPTEVAPDAMAQVPTDTSAAAGGVDPGSAPSEKPVETAAAATPSAPKASLKKVRETPFHEGGQLLNAVYIAQSNDSYKKISKMVYGDNSHVKDLKKGNPAISSPKVGDKVYYNSPSRPTDEVAMKNFYEDQGTQPQVYVAKDGDDLKKVAKDLLGNKSGWKELWVTNKDLESKGTLMAGTEIHYWKPAVTAGADAKASNVAMNGAPPADAMAGGNDQLPPPPPNMGENAPPSMDQLPPAPPADSAPSGPPQQAGMNGAPAAAAGAMAAANEIPPPPPVAEQAPPPPPPPMEQAPPPPPPQMAQKAPKAQLGKEPEGGLSNDDMMMGLAAAGILAAGIAAVMVIRKRRQQKELAASFGDTQIGAS